MEYRANAKDTVIEQVWRGDVEDINAEIGTTPYLSLADTQLQGEASYRLRFPFPLFLN